MGEDEIAALAFHGTRMLWQGPPIARKGAYIHVRY